MSRRLTSQQIADRKAEMNDGYTIAIPACEKHPPLPDGGAAGPAMDEKASADSGHEKGASSTGNTPDSPTPMVPAAEPHRRYLVEQVTAKDCRHGDYLWMGGERGFVRIRAIKPVPVAAIKADLGDGDVALWHRDDWLIRWAKGPMTEPKVTDEREQPTYLDDWIRRTREAQERTESAERERDAARHAIGDGLKEIAMYRRIAERAGGEVERLREVLKTLANPNLEEHEASAYVRRMADYARAALTTSDKGNGDG